jgi:uncharacterized protein YkwD
MRRLLWIAVLMAGCVSKGPVEPANVSMEKLIQLHNERRASGVLGQKPLRTDDKLMAYAQSHAEWMAENNRMRHSSMSKVLKLGFSMAGENIAWGQETEEGVVSAWMWSPGHRSNIMGTSYDCIGAGAAVRSGRVYWCVVFGRAW